MKSLYEEYFVVNWFEKKDGKYVLAIKKIYLIESFDIVSNDPNQFLYMGLTIYGVTLYLCLAACFGIFCSCVHHNFINDCNYDYIIGPRRTKCETYWSVSIISISKFLIYIYK